MTKKINKRGPRRILTSYGVECLIEEHLLVEIFLEHASSFYQCCVNYQMSYDFAETEEIGAPVPIIGEIFHYCQIHNPNIQF
ncbi:MAG TPA: hypothetical protein C5S50_05600 [Methanosarcinaceae archaeon]|nr:hypothetical protein [Methanosarcinaceae archaeon]